MKGVYENFCMYIHTRLWWANICVKRGNAPLHMCICFGIRTHDHACACVPMTSTGDRKKHPGSKIGIMTVSMHVRDKEQDVYKA